MGLLKSSMWFSLGTVLSRLSGLARDMILASAFGSSVFMDAFFVAYRIPNLFREMLAEGALAGAFTKVYVALNEKDKNEASQFLVDALLLIFLAGSVICLLGIVMAPWIVELMTMLRGAAESEALVVQATGLTRILFPFLGVMMMGSVAMGALHQWGRFFLSAFAPVNFNIGYIIGIVAIGPSLEAMFGRTIDFLQTDSLVTGVALGVLLGGIAQVAFYYYGLWDRALKNLKNRPQIRLNDNTRRFLKIMMPAALAASTGPINLVVNTNFATSLQEGSVTWLNYAFRLFQLPIGVFGVALSVAVLPALSRSIAKAGNKVDEASSQLLQRSIGLALWFILPCWLFLQDAGLDVVKFLFQRGQFDPEDALQTGQALTVYSYGLFGYALVKVLTSFYFAIERTTYALKIALLCIVINFSCNYYFVKVAGYNHVGLAATSATVLSFNAFLLFLGVFYSKVQFSIGASFRRAGMFLGGGVAALLLSRLFASLPLETLGFLELPVMIVLKALAAFIPFMASYYVFEKRRIR